MSNLDHAIATQRANLKRRRLWLRKQKTELRRDAKRFCGKPSTLVGAFLAGAALGAISSPRTRAEPGRTRNARESSPLRHQAISSLRLLLLNSVINYFSNSPGPHKPDCVEPTSI